MLAVVSDSSPIIYLTRLGVLSLLWNLHEKVIVPEAVWQEVAIRGAGLPESANLRQAVAEGHISVRTAAVSGHELAASAASLGQAELEAICLAKELGALLLTDDLDAGQFALRQGVRVSGTIGVLLRAKTEGHLAHVRPFLDRLRTEFNFRMSDQLFEAALEASGE